MARKQKEIVDQEDWNTWFTNEPPPDWLTAHLGTEKPNSSAKFSPLEARAKYVTEFGVDDGVESLPFLIAAEEAKFSENISDLLELVEIYYPKYSLRVGEKLKTSSPGARAKARFLKLVISRMLELMKFPKALINDFDILLSGYYITTSNVKPIAQRTILENPGKSYREICKIAKNKWHVTIDQSDLTQWIKSKSVIDPYAEGRRQNGPPRHRRDLSPDSRGNKR